MLSSPRFGGTSTRLSLSSEQFLANVEERGPATAETVAIEQLICRYERVRSLRFVDDS